MKKKVKRSDKCFFLFALHICLEKCAGSKGSRKCNKGFFQNFLHTCRSSFERRKLQKLQEIYDGMSCIAYTEDGESFIWMQSGTIPELIFRLWEPIRLRGQ